MHRCSDFHVNRTLQIFYNDDDDDDDDDDESNKPNKSSPKSFGKSASLPLTETGLARFMCY